jgi:hypothetical protein
MAFMIPMLLFDIGLLLRLLQPQVAFKESLFEKQALDQLEKNEKEADQRKRVPTVDMLQQDDGGMKRSGSLSDLDNYEASELREHYSKLSAERVAFPLREYFSKLSLGDRATFWRERDSLAWVNYRVVFLLAVSTVTLFMSLFVAASIGELQEQGLDSSSLRGKTLSLLFILEGVIDGQGLLFAVLFAADVRAERAYSAWFVDWSARLRACISYSYDEGTAQMSIADASPKRSRDGRHITIPQLHIDRSNRGGQLRERFAGRLGGWIGSSSSSSSNRSGTAININPVSVSTISGVSGERLRRELQQHRVGRAGATITPPASPANAASQRGLPFLKAWRAGAGGDDDPDTRASAL